MWDRAELKQKAKWVLAGSYWKAFLVSLVMGIVSGGSSNIGSGFNNRSSNSSSGSLGSIRNNSNEWFMILIIIGIIGVITFIIIMAVNLFVGYHLEVGGRRYFVQAAQDDINMGYLGYGFKNDRYFSIIKTMFWKDLMIFLWSLLLIIPGIIKKYAYKMVPYILADNPEIGRKRALELSDQMTKGHKFRIFVLQLSFMGWYLLGMLACLVGMMFVTPYQNATEAELYLVLRQQAIEKGLCDYQELNIVRKFKAIE